MTNNVVIGLDHAEVRLLRKRGYKAITSAKLRHSLDRQLSGADKSEGLALAVGTVERLGAISSIVQPANWRMWSRDFPLPLELEQAFKGLEVVETPFKAPKEAFYVHKNLYAGEAGRTIVLVAENTCELVRTADTYKALKPYRPQGRMDDPIYPEEHKACLITIDELRLIRLDRLNSCKVSIVFTFPVGLVTGHLKTTGQLLPTPPKQPGAITQSEQLALLNLPKESCKLNSALWPWPSSVQALCGEYEDVKVIIAPLLVPMRMGQPFFLGLSRGVGYETESTTSATSKGAREFCLETNQAPQVLKRTVVMWEGGDDITQLIRYGGLKIYTGNGARGGKRRKVQLLSLGLIRAETLNGVGIFELDANADTLQLWALSGTFKRPASHWRAQNARKANKRAKTNVTSIHQGDVIYNILCPPGVQKLHSESRQARSKLKGLKVLELSNLPMQANEATVGRVAHVLLKNIQTNTAYLFNGRCTVHEEHVSIDSKRWGIRLFRWAGIADQAPMLEYLKQQPCVIMAGRQDTTTGAVYAIVRVDDGTEDQQYEAVTRFGQTIGDRFSSIMGTNSYLPLEIDEPVTLETIDYTNWNVAKLMTKCYKAYQREGDYGKPTLVELRKSSENTPTRALKYLGGVKTLAEEGKRNTTLTSVVLCVLERFGEEGLAAIEEKLYELSTLDAKEITNTIVKLRRSYLQRRGIKRGETEVA